VCVSLTLPALLVAPAAASGKGTATRSHGTRASHRSKVTGHVPTVLSVSMVSTPAHVAAPLPAKAAPSAVAPARAGTAPVGCKNVNLAPSAANLAAIEAATLCLVNKARAAQGIAGLSENADLDEAANLHSADMVSEDYFDHVAPDGSSPEQRVRAAGYAPRGGDAVAENIASATPSEATPAETVAVWMASAGHRENILDPDFTETGIGVAAGVPALLGSRSGGTYTEDFA
jgi:uncharacterized protein YkwD